MQSRDPVVVVVEPAVAPGSAALDVGTEVGKSGAVDSEVDQVA